VLWIWGQGRGEEGRGEEEAGLAKGLAIVVVWGGEGEIFRGFAIALESS